jgi:hypothetical protein
MLALSFVALFLYLVWALNRKKLGIIPVVSAVDMWTSALIVFVVLWVALAYSSVTRFVFYL